MAEAILGMPGVWADDAHEASDHYTTKIGGLPDWPFAKDLVGPDVLQCSTCLSNRCLIAQVYAPVSDVNLKIEERVIYVFGCTNSRCKSWHVIRVQKSDICEKSRASSHQDALLDVPSASVSLAKSRGDLPSVGPVGDEDFEDDHDDIDMEELGRALSAAATLASASSKQNKKKDSGTKVSPHFDARGINNSSFVLPCFYIYTEEEKSSKDVPSICASYSSLSIKEKRDYSDDDHLKDKEWEGECYESDRALNADRSYLKFKKRLDAYPEQCLRYSYGGKPLLATPELGDPGRCGVCGGFRHYEMQLMSPLLYFLQEAAGGSRKDLLENWDWMTLVVYTCQKSCFGKANQHTTSTDGWTVVEEAAIAQFDDLNKSLQVGYFS